MPDQGVDRVNSFQGLRGEPVPGSSLHPWYPTGHLWCPSSGHPQSLPPPSHGPLPACTSVSKSPLYMDASRVVLGPRNDLILT